MTHIHKPDVKAILQTDRLPVSTGDKMIQYTLCIVHGIKRLYLRLAGTHCLPVLPLRLRLLNVSTVLQHDIAQLRRGPDRHHLSAESIGIDIGKHSNVVNMSMSDQNIIDLTITHRQRSILIFIHPLFHTAIHQHLQTTCLQQMAAAGNLMRRTNKC